jgi:hypothetical protein
MKNLIIIGIFFLFIIFIIDCKKDTSQSTNSSSLALTLKSKKDSVALGLSDTVTATVTGASGAVSYFWSVNTSNGIQGGGHQVAFWALCTSCPGPNVITCLAKDANNNSATKNITITVTQ